MGERQRSRRVDGKKRETRERRGRGRGTWRRWKWDGMQMRRGETERREGRDSVLEARRAKEKGDGRIPTFEFLQYAPLWLPTSIFISPPHAHVKENYPYLAQMARS
jgi:hypothetical protein